MNLFKSGAKVCPALLLALALIFGSTMAFSASPGRIAAEAAADIAAARMEKECQSETGPIKLRRKAGYKHAASLGGDRWVVVVDSEKLACIRSAVCGTGGCLISVISQMTGKTKTIYAERARGWRIVTPKIGATYIRLDVHGTHCGKPGSAECYERLDLATGTISSSR